MTEGYALRNSEGNLAQDPVSRQLMPATLGLILVAHGLSKRDSRYISLGCGLLYAVALRVATGCYNMASYCGESSPRPMSASM